MKFKTRIITSTITLLSILFFLLLLSTASAQTLVSIEPQKIQVEENEEFTLAVTISPDVAMSGAELRLTYEPALLTVTEITEGPFLKKDGGNTMFSGGSIDNEQGTVTGIYGVIMGKEMILEPDNFIEIKFTAGSEAGISDIGLENVLLSNSTGASLPITVSNGKVLIGNVEEEIPEDPSDQAEEKSAGQNILVITAVAMAGVFLLARRK